MQSFQETINKKKIFVSLLAIILTSLFIIFISGFADIFLQRIKDLVFYRDIRLDLNSSKERFFLLKRTFDLIIEYPFGVGLGNWQVYFPANGIANTNWEQGLVTVTVAHTDLLSIIAFIFTIYKFSNSI